MFKLLGDKRLFAGGADLNKIDGLFYTIIKIIRNEIDSNFEYELKDDLVIISGGKEELKIPVENFKNESLGLLTKIRDSTGSFRIPEAEAFMKSINCQTLKAKSTSKTDIRIVIHDQRTNQATELGFSIKSRLGGEATLLNAGRTTNFIYRINNFKPRASEVTAINQIDTKNKIKDRIEAIKKFGGTLQFTTIEQDVFKNNLVLIDSLLPNILAETLKTFFTTNLSSTKDLTESINKNNPLDYDKHSGHGFYEYKIKRFLTDVALGMTPSKVWTGIYDATGGYLIVKENGDILCYHLYNRNQFEDYLFSNTKFETASSKRHEFGKIYQEEDNFFFKLNLQVRFT